MIISSSFQLWQEKFISIIGTPSAGTLDKPEEQHQHHQEPFSFEDDPSQNRPREEEENEKEEEIGRRRDGWCLREGLFSTFSIAWPSCWWSYWGRWGMRRVGSSLCRLWVWVEPWERERQSEGGLGICKMRNWRQLKMIIFIWTSMVGDWISKQR